MSKDKWIEKQEFFESEIAAHYNLSLHELKFLHIEEISKSLPEFEANDSVVQPYKDGIYLAGDSVVEPSQNGALKSGRLAIEALLS